MLIIDMDPSKIDIAPIIIHKFNNSFFVFFFVKKVRLITPKKKKRDKETQV